MADRLMIEALVATGLTPEDAAERVDQVFAAAITVLARGRYVRIPGVGELKAPMKRVWVPGSCKRRAVEQRKIELRGGNVIEKGEAYDVDRRDFGAKSMAGFVRPHQSSEPVT
jgi:hypothetical protein